MFLVSFVQYSLIILGFLIAAQFITNVLQKFKDDSKEKSYKLDQEPTITVIIPCKGSSQDFEAFLSSLCFQDYQNGEVIFCFSNDQDPGIESIRRIVDVRNYKICISPYFESTTDKNQNYIAALNQASAESSIFVFLDSDGVLPHGYLSALVAPLADRRYICSSTFRIHNAKTLGALIIKYWNYMSLYFRKTPKGAFVWAGGMAVRREDLSTLNIPELWFNTLSDDMMLSQKIKDLKGKIFLVDKYCESTIDHSTFQAMSWIRRQNLCAFLCCPFLRHANQLGEILSLINILAFVLTLNPLFLLPILGLFISIFVLAIRHGSIQEQLLSPWIALMMVVTSIWISVTLPFLRTVYWAEIEYKVDNAGRIITRRPIVSVLDAQAKATTEELEQNQIST